MKKIIKNVVKALFIFTFAFVGITLSSCGKQSKAIVKKELAKVSQATIAYDGEVLSWGAINNAEQYIIKYDGKEVKVDQAKCELSVENDVTFEIRAIVSDTNQSYKSCEEFVGKSFIYKGKITPTLDYSTKIYSWSAVDGTEGYKIKENGSIYQGFQQATNYKLVGKLDETGNYLETFQVKAVFKENNYFTIWSDENKVTILSEPQNVSYDGSIIKWDKVNLASNYEVKVYSVDNDGNESVIKKEVVSASDYVFNVMGDNDGTSEGKSTAVNGSYSISISALTDEKEGILSSSEARFAFSYVDPITEIAMSEGVLSWEEITNADYYVLEINGEEHAEKITTNKYSGFDHSKYATYTVRVMPKSYDGSLYSNWSARFIFTSLVSPNVRWISDGQAYSLDWSVNMDGEPYNPANTSYEIIIKEYGTGNLIDTITTSDTYYYGEELLSKIGKTKNIIRSVQVKATRSAELEASSESFLSDPIYFYNLPDPSAYTISTKDVYADTLKTKLYFNDLQINGAFKDYNVDIKYRAGVNSAEGNYNSNEAVSNETVRDIDIPSNESITGEAVKISYKCESKDNLKMLTNKDNEKTVFILSDTVNTIDCERLASPSPRLVGTSITWDAVSMASSYQIKVEDLLGTQIGDLQITVGNSFNIANLNLDAGKYNISVSALGNGNIIFSSLYSNQITFNQLGIPSNLRIEGNGDSRKITWDAVDDCSSYELYIGTHKLTVNNSNEMAIEQEYLSIAGNGVTVAAIGNSANKTLSSNPSNAIVIYKLKTPSNVRISDSQITWNSVDAYEGKAVGYEVWIGNERISGDKALTKTSFSYYDYAAIKESYDTFNLDVQVRAVLVSEDKQFFASEMSAISNVSRLASPNNVQLNQYTGKITWDEKNLDLNTISGYEVKITYSNHKNLTQTYITCQTSYTPTFNERCVGDIATITVRALGNGVDNVSSNPYNVSVDGKENMIGCYATVVKLDAISSDAISYSVDKLNHIQVKINESKLNDIKSYAYGIKIDGVLNTMARYDSGYYSKDVATGLYTYKLDNGSVASYDPISKIYTYTSRNSEAGDYDIDVKLVGGNYSCDTRLASSVIDCFIDSDYTNNPKTIVILGQFVESDISLNMSAYASTISLLNKTHAVSYEYTIQYLSMGENVGSKVSSCIVASTDNNTIINLGSVPENATSIRISVKVKGNANEYIFDSIRTFTTDLIISNVDLTK